MFIDLMWNQYMRYNSILYANFNQITKAPRMHIKCIHTVKIYTTKGRD